MVAATCRFVQAEAPPAAGSDRNRWRKLAFVLSPSGWAEILTVTHGELHRADLERRRSGRGAETREDEPPGEGWRIRANTGDDEHQGDEDLENRHAGLAPRTPVYGSGRPAFSPPTVLRGRGRIFPAPARGNPAPQSPGH
jgi:hypothetical protein